MGRFKIPTWLLRLGMRYLPWILENISPEIREYVRTFITDLEIKADKTDNKIDDILVDLLKAAFDMD